MDKYFPLISVIAGLVTSTILWFFIRYLFRGFSSGRQASPEQTSIQTKEEIEAQPPPLPTSSFIPRPPYIGFIARKDVEGRDLIEQLKEELDPQKNQMIVLFGSGGVGKTTLAAETARALIERFSSRIIWVSAEDRVKLTLSILLDQIATQLGKPDLRKAVFDQKSEMVRDLLTAAPTLIVLDNFETVAPDDQTEILRWLTQRPSSSVLITTRQWVEASRNVPVSAMSPTEAQTCLERLIKQAPDPRLFENLDYNHLIQVAGANPLVLQWVVAQVSLAQEVDAVLNDLKRGEGSAAERVFDHSFNLVQLGDDGRTVLLALSLFTPSASRAALAEVADLNGDIKRLNEAVKSLAALSLIKTTDNGGRLRIDGLTRELACARLNKDARAEQFKRAFMEYFVRYVESHGGHTPKDFNALEEDKDNILNSIELAIEAEQWDSIIRIVNIISREADGVLIVRGYWHEAIKSLYQAMEAARTLSDEKNVALLGRHLAAIRMKRGEYTEARKLYLQALGSFREMGNQRGLTSTLYNLGMLAMIQGELIDAEQYYNESLEIMRQVNDQRGIADAFQQLGMLALNRGELVEARRLFDKSLVIRKNIGDQQGVARALHNLGIIAQTQGEMEEARKLYNDSLELKKRLGDESRGSTAITFYQLGLIAQKQGNLVEAQKLFDESLEIRKSLGDQHGIAVTLHQLGIVAQSKSELERAEQLFNESLEIKKRLGDQFGIASTLQNLAVIAREEGNSDEAQRLLNESLVIRERLGNQRGIAITLHQLGVLAATRGAEVEAKELFDDSLRIKERLGDKSGMADTFNELSKLALSQNKLEEARRLCEQSLEIGEMIKDQNGIAASLWCMGKLELTEGNKSKAEVLMLKAFGIWQRLNPTEAEIARKELIKMGLEVK